MKCVHCGNELMPGSKFCTNCGTPVSEPVTPVPSPNTGSSQDPMGNWPASDFTAPPENSSPDSVAEEISAAGGSVPSAPQSAPVYQESISQDSFSASGSAAQEAPSECGDIPSAVPPAGHQAQADGMPSAPYGQAGGPPPAYPQNYAGNIPPAYPQSNNGGTPPVYPNQTYYPQPGYPQGPTPPKKSSKLVLGIVLGIAALIIVLIVVLVVVLLNNNKSTKPASSSSAASSSVSSQASDGASSAPSGETVTLTIGSASFTVPSEWKRDIDEDGTIFLYPSADETIIIYCFADEAQYYSENDYLETYAQGYDDYQYISLEETSVSGISGKLHTYYAHVSDIDYEINSFYYTIGDDLMSVDYFRPLLSSSDGIQPLEDVLATLQIAEGAGSANFSASSNGGSAAIQDSYGEGMYKIGADLPAGEYVLLPASEFSAYYEVNSSSTGELEDIIDNDNFDGRRYLTVEDGQYLTIQRCMMVPLDKAPKVDISSGVVPEGMYRVGVDIPAGEYKLRNNAEYDGYYEVRSISLAAKGLDSIITNENFSGDVYVTVQEGQYLVVNRAELQLPQ